MSHTDESSRRVKRWVHTFRDPRLWLPFALAGLVAAGADLLRAADPVPTVVRTIAPSTFHVQLPPTPGLFRLIGVDAAALVGLRPRWLVAVALVQTVTLLTSAVATAAVVATCLDRPEFRSVRAVGRLAGYYLAVAVVLGVMGVVAQAVSLLGLVFALLGFWVLSRAFVAPVAALAGAGPVRAVAESFGRTRGHALPLFGVLFVVDVLARTVLADLPFGVSAFVATALLGTAHAVVAARTYRHLGDGRDAPANRSVARPVDD